MIGHSNQADQSSDGARERAVLLFVFVFAASIMGLAYAATAEMQFKMLSDESSEYYLSTISAVDPIQVKIMNLQHFLVCPVVGLLNYFTHFLICSKWRLADATLMSALLSSWLSPATMNIMVAPKQRLWDTWTFTFTQDNYDIWAFIVPIAGVLVSTCACAST